MQDVDELLLPAGSVDFGPRSPVIAAGSGGRVFRCKLTLPATTRTTLTEDVALKETYAMQDMITTREGVFLLRGGRCGAACRVCDLRACAGRVGDWCA